MKEIIVQQYGRVYQLIIGNNQESIVIEQLNIEFDIMKTITQDPNPAIFALNNLNQSNRNLITDKKYSRIMFNAGYLDQMRTLFIGYIDNVENIKEGTEIITKMTCNDGQQDYRNARVAVTVAKGATDKEIVKQVTGAMQNTEIGQQDFTTERQLPRGKTLVGNARDVLSQVAKNQNADWSIQDNQLVMLPKTHAFANNEGFLISEATGMIGSPQKVADGLEVRCYLNNMMRVGQLCRVESVIREMSGDFKITKINMKGGIKSNDWMCVLTLINGQFKEIQKDKK